MDLRDFKINVPDGQIADLKLRLRSTRFPAALDADQWDDGASLAFVRRLADYWLHQFDWRAQEARLNRLPQFQATVEGHDIHFVYQTGKGPAPMPRGGHFAALEQPELLVEDIRAFFRPLRRASGQS
jgi:hypothetical protein